MLTNDDFERIARGQQIQRLKMGLAQREQAAGMRLGPDEYARLANQIIALNKGPEQIAPVAEQEPAEPKEEVSPEIKIASALASRLAQRDKGYK